MKVNVKKICWTTTVDHAKIALDYVDCYMLAALLEPCLELGGLSFARGESIVEDANARFDGHSDVDEWIERSKEKLVDLNLIIVKETSSGVHVGLNKDGLTVARRLQSHLNKFIPIMRLCDRKDNPILNAIEWTKE